MKKGLGYYMKNYFKHNLVVLLFELVIIVLIGVLVTMLLGGQPAWLGPVLAVTGYLLAEIRFMMAYIAEKSREAAEQEAQADELIDAPVETPDETPDVELDEISDEAAKKNAEEAVEGTTEETSVAEVENQPAEKACEDEVGFEESEEDSADAPDVSSAELEIVLNETAVEATAEDVQKHELPHLPEPPAPSDLQTRELVMEDEVDAGAGKR